VAVSRQVAEPGSVLANRSFVKLWAGETVSVTGNVITTFALPLVALVTLHASAFQVGVLNAVRYAPMIMFSLLAGFWLDRHRRKPTLIASDLACAVLIALIPLASVVGSLTIWLLYAVAFIVGIPQVLFDIGCLSYVPGLVERRHLAEANSKLQISYAVAGVAGPSLGGLLIGLLTAPILLTFDAASYLFSMIMLLAIRRPEPCPETTKETASVRSFVAEGLRVVWSNGVLRFLVMQSCAFNLIFNALITVFVVYAIRTLGLSTSELGIVIGSVAAGGFVGAVLANPVRTVLGVGRTLFAATVGTCLSPLLLLVPHGSSPRTLVILALSQSVYGVSVVIYNINSMTLRQMVTPNRFLARMNGSSRMLLFGTALLGALIGGALGSSLGLRPALVITALALTTPIAGILVSPVFRLKDMPSRPDEQTFRDTVSRPAATSSAASDH